MSSQSLASYSHRTGANSSQTACLDFTPIPADNERFEKCESFWRFVESSPALERMKKIAAKQIVQERLQQVRQAEEQFQPLCLHKLNEISKRGITKTALDLPLQGHGCSSGNLTDSFTEPDVAAAINAKLKTWDRAHTCWSIPPSTKYTVHTAQDASTQSP